MSALLDSLTVGGYDGSADGGIGASGYTVYPTVSSGGGDFWSGLLQNTTALGTGYLSRLMDIDLTKKYISAMPNPTLSGTQNPVGYGTVVKGSNGQNYATLNLSAMMPLLLVAALVFVVAKKKGG